MQDKNESQRNIDIWLVLVIVVIVLSMGGGLWVTGKSLMARLDEMSIRVNGQISTLQTEIFELRKQVQDVDVKIGKVVEDKKLPEQPKQLVKEVAKSKPKIR